MLFFFFVGYIREEEEEGRKNARYARLGGSRGKGKRRSSPTFQFPKKEELEVFFPRNGNGKRSAASQFLNSSSSSILSRSQAAYQCMKQKKEGGRQKNKGV